MSNPVDLLKSKGYSIFSVTKNDDCQITINANGINFSIKTVENMKCPPFVLCGINRETKMFSVVSCPDDSVEGALPFVKNGKPTTARVGISSVILKSLMPEWDFDHFYYKVMGVLSNDNQLAEFDFNKAVPFARRKSKSVESEVKAVSETSAEEPTAEPASEGVADKDVPAADLAENPAEFASEVSE